MELDKSRLDVLEKIVQYEKEGKFDIDVENDPPSLELKPDQVDYLQRKISSKIMRQIANYSGKKLIKSLIKNGMLVIKDIKGIENLKNLSGGAVLTCNHFGANDSFLMQCVFEKVKHKRQRMYKVIREGNYTNPPGFSLLFRNCDVLPLSSNKTTMKNFISAVDTLLSRGNYVLLYPEEAMWWNYRKPRPLKNGAYHFASKNKVPVVPIFVTMEDTDKIGPDGFAIQAYTINILEPIYPDSSLHFKDNIEMIKNKNFTMWKDVYESFYNTKLVYTTKK